MQPVSHTACVDILSLPPRFAIASLEVREEEPFRPREGGLPRSRRLGFAAGSDVRAPKDFLFIAKEDETPQWHKPCGLGALTGRLTITYTRKENLA